MKIEEKIARAIVEGMKGAEVLDGKVILPLVRDFAHHLATEYHPDHPLSSETATIAPNFPKTASLFFDRVWWPHEASENGAPREIRFFGGTEAELWAISAAAVWANISVENSRFGPELVTKLINSSPLPAYLGRPNQRADISLLCNALYEESGIRCQPAYSHGDSMSAEFKAGDRSCLLAVVQNLEIVDEKTLTWTQVQDFRKDKEALLKFRRMRNWVDSEMADKPIEFIADTVAMKLSDYEWALKKHGFQTFTGTLSDLLEPSFLKVIGPAVGALWAGGLWLGAGTGLAELAAGGLVLGKMTVSLVNRRVDLADRKRSQGAEVAFVHELKKLSK